MSGGGGVWVLTDGRAGNENPALALAEALEPHGWPPADVRRLALRGWSSRLPAQLWSALPAREEGWPFSGLSDPSVAARPWPALVISAGRRAAPVAAAMKRLGGVKAVQILDPKAGRFDAVVTPEHDALRGANVVPTLGSLSRVTPERAAQAAGPWRARLADLPRPRLAVMVGGPSGSARWTQAESGRLVEALRRAEAEGWGLMVTPSRRTPPEVSAALSGLGGFVWDGRGENPYPGILGLADAAAVTADSVNMASEAAAAGLPVNVLFAPPTSPKIRAFHEALAASGASRPWQDLPHIWDSAPLREAGRVAALLVRDYIGRP